MDLEESSWYSFLGFALCCSVIFQGLSEARGGRGLRSMLSGWGSELWVPERIYYQFLNIEFPCDIVLEKKVPLLKDLKVTEHAFFF